MEKDCPSFYAIIPAYVRYDKNLTANAKLLYGEITALCNQTGYCWASNAYFAKLYNVSRSTVSSWIADLQKNGYINVEITYKKDSNEVDKRIITIIPYELQGNKNLDNDTATITNNEDRCSENQKGCSENQKGCSENQKGCSEIPKDNNTINNTNNNNNNNINTLCEQVHREEEKTPGKQSKTKKEKYTEQDKELALYLKAKLEERGATVFPRDWLMKNYATAHRLLKTVSLDELKSCIDWLLEDNYWQSRVDSLIVVEKKIAQFQMQNNGKIGKSPYDDLF